MLNMLFGMQIGRKIQSSLEFYQSPLFEKIRNYLTKYDSENKTIFIFVPFIKTKVFKKLVENLYSKIVVITTWDTRDILTGSSELDLYPVCKEKGISLYINNEIHLKVFVRWIKKYDSVNRKYF